MNAPSTFQWSTNTVLQGVESFSSCYIDDIVIYSAVWEDHIIEGSIRLVETILTNSQT